MSGTAIAFQVPIAEMRTQSGISKEAAAGWCGTRWQTSAAASRRGPQE